MFEFFQKGGPLMYPLLLCSVLTLTFSIERAYRYARLTGRKKLVSEIKDYLLKGEHEKAIKLGEEDNGAVAAVITEAIRNKDNSIQIIEEAVSLKGSYELKKLNEHLHILELIGRMAPLIGLLGTVLGMVEAFKKVAYMKRVGRPLNPCRRDMGGIDNNCSRVVCSYPRHCIPSLF